MSEQPNCKHYNRAGACYLCWHELVQECEGLRAQLATTPPADAAMVDDALCESLIEASDMRWNGDVYVGDGADLMNLVRAALRARAAPDGMVQVDINLIDDEWMNAAMRDAGIVRSVGAPPETIIRAAISGYLLAARNRWRRSEDMSEYRKMLEQAADTHGLLPELLELYDANDRLRAELEAAKQDAAKCAAAHINAVSACNENAHLLTKASAELAELRARAGELERQVRDKHEAATVDEICNAYESGVGHNGRATANVNPYPPGTPQHTAYELGAKGTKHSAAAVPEGWSLAAHPDGGIVVQHRTLGGCFVTEKENQPREIPGQILFYLASDMLAAIQPQATAVDDETKEFFLSHRFDQLGKYPNDRALILLTEAGFNFVRAAILSATETEGRKDE